jgi:hypothetical protein
VPTQSLDSARGPESSHEPPSRTSPLFEQVLAACGIPQFIARSSLTRAFERAGTDVGALTLEALERSLSDVRQTLRVFLPPSEAERHAAAIAALIRKPS